MNKLLKTIVVFWILIPVVLKAQPVTWQKWYDYNNDDNEGEDVIQTFDGGYLFLGQNYSSFNNGIVLIKTDQNGTVQWKKLIGRDSANGADIISLSVCQVPDSGFVLSGYDYPSAYLLKINKYGNIVWIRKYSKPGFEIRFYDHKLTFDGGIITCGDIYSPLKAYVAKIDSSGIIEWDNSYNANDFIKVLQSRDSNYYFARYNYLVKTDSKGRVIWDRGFFRGGPYMVENVSGYLFSGGSAGVDTMYLNKFDASGNLMWGKKFYPSAYCYSICMSLDGSLLLAGYADSLSMGIIAVAKVDMNGNEIFTKQILSTIGNNLSFLPFSVKSTTDSGFIMTGFTNYGGFPTRDNILAVKTDSKCNAPLITGIINISVLIPNEIVLYQNFPNPFNPSTKIKYQLSKRGFVNLRIYDAKGMEICQLVNQFQTSGQFEILFNAANYGLASAVYFLRLEVDEIIETRKMLLLK